MASFSAYKDEYESNWRNLQIRPASVAGARKLAGQLLRGKATYQEVQTKTGVPWWFVGLCHYREAAFDFDTYLGNGQPLSRRTTIVPKGRGPFTGPNPFVDGAVDALDLEHLLHVSDWGIARTLFRLEGYNGYGYHSQGVNSPYLYGGSTCYGPPEAKGGKYVADHVFDPRTVDRQLGTAVILKSLLELDSAIDFSAATPTLPGQSDQPDDEFARDILWVQQSLNKLGIRPQLTEDGKNGPLTMAAVSQFQQQNGLPDTGLADVATVAAIQRRSMPTAAPAIDILTQRVAGLETRLGAPSVNSGTIQPPVVVQASGEPPAVVPPSSEPTDHAALLARLLELVQAAQAPATATPAPTAAQLADQLKKAAELLSGILVPGNGSPPLGQVNGALGETVGNLLNGKKTAIGIIGGALTSVLSHVPATTGLGQVLTSLTPTSLTPTDSLSQFSMPIFLALAAWGTLGKLEKWAQGRRRGPW